MQKYLLAIGLALLQTTFSMARDQAPAQNKGFEKEGYISQESYKEFADSSDLIGARNSKQLQADMQKNDMYNDNDNDNVYKDDNNRRWGRKKSDDGILINETNGDNCCPKPKAPCCPKPKCCKPKCCPKPKAPCCPKPKCCKPKCPKPCCKPCEPTRQPSCTYDGCCEPVRGPACTYDGCCEPTRLMQCEKPKCCKPKCSRPPKCCDDNAIMQDNGNCRDNLKDRSNNMMNPRNRNATRDMQ